MTDDHRHRLPPGRPSTRATAAPMARFVGAVRTTGIYCKPSCAARHPRRENVSFYRDRRGGARGGLSRLPALPPR